MVELFAALVRAQQYDFGKWIRLKMVSGRVSSDCLNVRVTFAQGFDHVKPTVMHYHDHIPCLPLFQCSCHASLHATNCLLNSGAAILFNIMNMSTLSMLFSINASPWPNGRRQSKRPEARCADCFLTHILLYSVQLQTCQRCHQHTYLDHMSSSKTSIDSLL